MVDAISGSAQMNVLTVVGSPRINGNTEILASKITEGARAGGADVHTAHLGPLTIRECDGCQACWRGRPCTKDDDMRPLYPKIAAADLLVFATPVYWYGPTALMKAFIDRFVYFNGDQHRPEIRGKKALVALVLEEDDPATWQPVLEFFYKCFEYLEITPAGAIVVPGVGPRGAILEKPDRLEEAFEFGQSAALAP